MYDKKYFYFSIANPSSLDIVIPIEGNPPTNQTKIETTKMKSIIRTSLKNFISDLREIRNNKSVPVLLGQGYTIAVKGQISTISRQSEGFNFSGTWNRGVSYWTKEVATKGAEQLRSSLPFEIEVIHHNDIRDRHEAVALDFVKNLFQHRNKVA